MLDNGVFLIICNGVFMIFLLIKFVRYTANYFSRYFSIYSSETFFDQLSKWRYFPSPCLYLQGYFCFLKIQNHYILICPFTTFHPFLSLLLELDHMQLHISNFTKLYISQNYISFTNDYLLTLFIFFNMTFPKGVNF